MISIIQQRSKLIVLVTLLLGIGLVFQNCGSSASTAQSDGASALSGGSDSFGGCTASEFICAAYSELLGRLPDRDGALYYTGLINGTTSESARSAMYDTIINEIANSPEANGMQPLAAGTVMCSGTVICR